MPDYTIEVQAAPTLAESDWTADIGNWVSLTRDNFLSGSETVSDELGMELTRGDDYEMDYDAGRVKALEGGSLANGESSVIEYAFRPIDYNFVVENVQAVVRPLVSLADWSDDVSYQDWHFTKVPVWKPPERFPPDVGGRQTDQIEFTVRDSSDDIVVDGDLLWTVRYTGIAGEDLDHSLIFLIFEEATESLPDEEPWNAEGEPPPYPTPWGRYVDRSKLVDGGEGTEYCW